MALFIYCAISLVVFLNFVYCATNIDLELSCGELSQHAECSFVGHGVYTPRSESVSTVSLNFNSLRNSKLNLQNLPSVKLLQIASKNFDQYDPCQHVIGNRQTVTVEIESKTTICPPAVATTSQIDTGITTDTTGTSKDLATKTPTGTSLKSKAITTDSSTEVVMLNRTSDGTTRSTMENDKLILTISISLALSFIVILIIVLILCKVMRKCCFGRENINEVGDRGSSIDLFNLAETSFSKFVNPTERHLRRDIKDD